MGLTIFYKNDGQEFSVTPPMQDAFNSSGYLLVKGLLGQEEMDRMRECVEGSKERKEHTYGRSDGGDKGFDMSLWWRPGDDTLGLVTRCERIAGTAKSLLGGLPIYHLSSKYLNKAAGEGGPFPWHQDYGYFYHNAVLSPDNLSVFIPLDPCFQENGCLKVIPRSHLLGRLDHSQKGELATVDQQRLEHIQKLLGVENVVMDPGDVLFFHSNLLHSTGPNTSSLQRRALIVAFNQERNAPYNNDFLPVAEPLDMIADSQVLTNHKLNSSIDKHYSAKKKDTSTNKMN